MALNPISKYALEETKLRLKRFTKNLRLAAKQAENPEAIHDLRVSIRRVTQAFRIFHDLLDPHAVKKLRRRLHGLMDLCSVVRNIDVALSLLDQLGVTSASVARLGGAREDAVRKLRRRLKDEIRKRHPAPNARAHPKEGDWNLAQNLEINLRRLLPALAEEFFDAGKAAISPHASYRTLHQFRLCAKRFRYTLELFEDFYGTEMARGAEILKELQDRLGAINDCATTIGLLGRDRHAVAAMTKLLRQSKAALRGYAQGRFARKDLDQWKRWLALPAQRAA